MYLIIERNNSIMLIEYIIVHIMWNFKEKFNEVFNSDNFVIFNSIYFDTNTNESGT